MKKQTLPVQIPATISLASRKMLLDFFEAMALKFEEAEKRHNWQDKWKVAEAYEIQPSIMEHVSKGDPRDVAILCAIAHHHGFPTVPKKCDPAGSCHFYRNMNGGCNLCGEPCL